MTGHHCVKKPFCGQRALFVETAAAATTLLLLALLPSLGESEILKFQGTSGGYDMQRQHMTIGRPFFRSTGRTYRVKNGQIVTMECNIENMASSVIVWKQTDRIISAGERLIRKDSRMRLVKGDKGISLQIENVTPDDKGEYICEVETFGEPIDQINQLHVLVPPVISTLHPGKNLTVRKGSIVRLACNATGFPPPNIVWQREYQMLPSGEKEHYGTSLVLSNVSRLDSGTYICGASNGVDQPVRARIELQVIYEPEIQVDKSWIHADVSVEVEISCVVHAEPRAEVKWYRDTMLLDPNEYRLMEQFGIRHTLVLRRVAEDDFGNYSCSAENTLGRSRAFIELSGHPNAANVTSRSLGYYSDHYSITWSVYSFSEITQYRIAYRKVIPRDDPMFDTRSRWHNVIPDMKQVIVSKTPPLQRGTYMFYALEPSSQYEVVIQSQNRWGWSQNSEPFFFSTRTTDFKPKVDETKPKGSEAQSDVQEESKQTKMHHESFLPISGKSCLHSSKLVFLIVLLIPILLV